MHRHGATPEHKQAQSVIFLSEFHSQQMRKKKPYVTDSLRHLQSRTRILESANFKIVHTYDYVIIQNRQPLSLERVPSSRCGLSSKPEAHY